MAVIDGRDGAVAGEPHAKNLGQAVHAVGSEEARTGTAAGTAGGFELFQLFGGNFAGFKTAGSLKEIADANVLALMAACQHRSAADNDRRNVQAGGGHEHAWNNFVTVRDEY